MSIYDNPVEYAELVSIPLEYAEKYCAFMQRVNSRIDEVKTCPKCNQKTLEWDGGEWEMSIPSYIYCDNDEIHCIDEDGEEYLTECDFTSKVADDYQLLAYGGYIDSLLWHTDKKLRKLHFGSEKRYVEWAIKEIERDLASEKDILK